MSHGHAYEVNIVISMGKSAKKLILSLLLTGRSYWPKINAYELHFARYLQGHPIWRYLERPNMHLHILTSFLLINSSTKRLIQMEWSPRDGGCRKQVCSRPRCSSCRHSLRGHDPSIPSIPSLNIAFTYTVSFIEQNARVPQQYCRKY